MSFGLLEKLPKRMQRRLLSTVAEMLKKLIRLSHEGVTIATDCEDFGLLLYQGDKNDPNSPLYATVVSMDANADVKEHHTTFVVDQLITQLSEKI